MVCTSEFWEMYAWEILDKQTSAMLIFMKIHVSINLKTMGLDE